MPIRGQTRDSSGVCRSDARPPTFRLRCSIPSPVPMVSSLQPQVRSRSARVATILCRFMCFVRTDMRMPCGSELKTFRRDHLPGSNDRCRTNRRDSCTDGSEDAAELTQPVQIVEKAFRRIHDSTDCGITTLVHDPLNGMPRTARIVRYADGRDHEGPSAVFYCD